MNNEIIKSIEEQDREDLVLREELKKAPVGPQDEKKAQKDTKPLSSIKTSSTALVAPLRGFTKEQLALIKRTVAKDATNDELAMFMHIAKKSGLDPFLKEIWFVKYRGGETLMMTARDGLLSIAQRSGEFNGLQSAAIYKNDVFSVDYSDPDDIKINHITSPFAEGNKEIVGAWARSRRKGCIDTISIVEFNTYKKTFAGKKSMWDLYPSAMITKVAEAIVLKKQYGIAGVVSKEEIGYENEETNTKELPDGEKLFNNTFKLLQQVPEVKRNQAIENAIASKQFTEEQILKLQTLKIIDKKTDATN